MDCDVWRMERFGPSDVFCEASTLTSISICFSSINCIFSHSDCYHLMFSPHLTQKEPAALCPLLELNRRLCL